MIEVRETDLKLLELRTILMYEISATTSRRVDTHSIRRIAALRHTLKVYVDIRSYEGY